MRVLLETDTPLWRWTDSPRQSGAPRAVIAGPENEVCVSAASIWVMRTKQRLGKFSLIPDLVVHVGELQKRKWPHGARYWLAGYARGRRLCGQSP